MEDKVWTLNTIQDRILTTRRSGETDAPVWNVASNIWQPAVVRKDNWVWERPICRLKRCVHRQVLVGNVKLLPDDVQLNKQGLSESVLVLHHLRCPEQQLWVVGSALLMEPGGVNTSVWAVGASREVAERRVVEACVSVPQNGDEDISCSLNRHLDSGCLSRANVESRLVPRVTRNTDLRSEKLHAEGTRDLANNELWLPGETQVDHHLVENSRVAGSRLRSSHTNNLFKGHLRKGLKGFGLASTGERLKKKQIVERELQ